MSTTRSQQVMWQGGTLGLPMSSKQQPGSLPRVKPAGIEAGLAAVVLAALSFSLVLAYAAASAAIARKGYAEMQTRQEVESLRARTALLRYQIHVAESNCRLPETADRLRLVRADPVKQVDYVSLPHSVSPGETLLAAAEPDREKAGLASALAEFATGVSSGGRAEASTVKGHRP